MIVLEKKLKMHLLQVPRKRYDWQKSWQRDLFIYLAVSMQILIRDIHRFSRILLVTLTYKVNSSVR